MRGAAPRLEAKADGMMDSFPHRSDRTGLALRIGRNGTTSKSGSDLLMWDLHAPQLSTLVQAKRKQPLHSLGHQRSELYLRCVTADVAAECG